MTPKEFTFDAAYQPQVRAKRGTREIMLDVIIALLPALCVGVWQFGAQALIPLAVSVVSCVFFEWAYRKLLKKPDTIGDLSAVVTGILLAFTLPANCKWWLPIIGAFFAIVVVKQLYGGIGKNFLNPALAGRAFLLASYALFMTAWVVPGSLAGVVDAETMATPLSYMKAGEALPQYFTFKSMFLRFIYRLHAAAFHAFAAFDAFSGVDPRKGVPLLRDRARGADRDQRATVVLRA